MDNTEVKTNDRYKTSSLYISPVDSHANLEDEYYTLPSMKNVDDKLETSLSKIERERHMQMEELKKIKVELRELSGHKDAPHSNDEYSNETTILTLQKENQYSE